MDRKALAPAMKRQQKNQIGTVIATFDKSGKYMGILVCDQYITPPNPKAAGPRPLRFGAHGNSNNGDNFHVAE
jgi:hypothetical protein